MKKIMLAALVGFMALTSAPKVEARSNQGPITYVAVATWTAGGDGSLAISFFNHSSPLEIRVKKITLTNFSQGVVQGGLIPFHILLVESVTDGGVLNVSTYSLGGSVPPFPFDVEITTGPVNPVFEGMLELPFVESCTLNNDDLAGTDLTAVCYEVRTGGRALILAADEERGFVIRQSKFKTDVDDGDLMVHIEFTAE